MSSMNVMVQILLGLSIVLIGLFVFWKYPLKKDVKLLMYSALFVVITVLLNRLSIMIPLFGFESFKIGFVGLSLMISGMILPPSYAYLVGLCVDFVGLILVPTQFPFFGFTLNSVLQPVIPSILCLYAKKIDLKHMGKICISLCIVLLVSAMYYILGIQEVLVSSEIILIQFMEKMLFMFIVILVFGILFCTIYRMKNKYQNDKLHDLYIWIMIVIIGQLLFDFILTPVWLEYMYGIPIMLSFFIRVIKACLMIPLEIMIGYNLIKILRKA